MKSIPTRRVSNAFMIGLFVIVSSLVMISTIIWLGANQFFKENMYYVTYFENSVQGLEIGSPVKYQGVPVGTVSKIGLAPDAKLVEVTIQINNSSNFNVDEKLRVRPEFAGVAGGKFLQLSYPATKELAEKHPALDFTPPHRVIHSVPSGFDEIESIAKKILQNMTQFDTKGLSDSTMSFLSTSTELLRNEHLLETIHQISLATTSLATILNSLQESDIVGHIGETSKNLEASSVELNKFTSSLNTRLDKMDLEKKLDNAVARYDEVMINLNKNINGISAQSVNLLLTVNEAVDNLKTTMKELKKSLRAVNDNPSGILLSKPPKNEK